MHYIQLAVTKISDNTGVPYLGSPIGEAGKKRKSTENRNKFTRSSNNENHSVLLSYHSALLCNRFKTLRRGLTVSIFREPETSGADCQVTLRHIPEGVLEPNNHRNLKARLRERERVMVGCSWAEIVQLFQTEPRSESPTLSITTATRLNKGLFAKLNKYVSF
jgi:hypothetical protein